MAGTALGQNLLSSLTGNIPKAVLFVRKYEEVKATDPNGQEAKSADMTEKARALQKDLLAKTKASLGGNTGTLDLSEYAAVGEKSGFVPLQVQYNPNSIYFDTIAGSQENLSKDPSNIMSTQLTQISADLVTNMAFQLIFDDMDVMDSFMLDSSMISTGGALSAIGKAAGIKKNEFTVKNEVEAIIACLLSPYTREVVFAWSDMVFYGQLFQVNAKYTMFNKRGNPVRATVEVTIQQGVDPESSAKGGVWDQAFDRAFGAANKSALSGGLSELSQATNNALLNLSI